MTTLEYRADVDGLRAVAVMAVLGFHAFPSLVPGGFVGVDIFFIISGYLITRILLRESDSGDTSIVSFYARRVVRIFPALALVLTACLFAGWHILLAAEYKQLAKHVLAGVGFVSNLVLWFEAGYFDAVSESKPLLHLWSLGIEEQFYIFWPLALILLTRRSRAPLPLMVAILLCSLLYAGVVVRWDRTEAFYSPLPRAWELMAGATLGSLQHTRHVALSKLNYRYAPWVGLLLIVVSVFYLESKDLFPGFWALLPVLGTALLIGTSPKTWIHSRLLANPVMVGIGLISYPIYLWHWPLLSFGHIIYAGEPPWSIRLALIISSFVLATATYFFVEIPVRKIPHQWAIGMLVTLVATLGAIGKNVYERDGLDFRYRKMIVVDRESERDFVDWENTGLITQSSCKIPFQFPGREYCLTRHVELPPTATLIGDSHAFHAYWGVAEAMDLLGDNLTLIGRGACVPLFNYSRGRDEDRCQPHMDAMLTYSADEPSIRKVILVFRGKYLPNDADESTQLRFASSLDATFNRLLKAGKTVFYVLPVVEPGFDPRLCLGNLPFGRKAPMSCQLSRKAEMEKTALLRGIVQSALKKYPDVQLLDPNDYLCDGDVCSVIREGRTMFKDENHISYSGSLFLGQKMLWETPRRTVAKQ